MELNADFEKKELKDMKAKRTYSRKSTNWCFTLANYTDDEVERINDFDCQYMIHAKETGEGGLPHLQGYLQCWKQERLSSLKKMFSSRAHLEIQRATDFEAATYCMKEAGVEIFTKGTMSKQGKAKLDWNDAVESVKAGVSTLELRMKHGSGFMMHRKKLLEVAKAEVFEEKKAKRREKIKDLVLRDWQLEVIELLKNQNDREILFVVDEEGGKGKTTLSAYIVATMDAARFENGRSMDIKYLYAGQKYVVFDYCRSSLDHINYEVLESIKNGMFTSTKYECESKEVEPPNVVVFMNQAPDRLKLSVDRFHMYKFPDMTEVFPKKKIYKPVEKPERSFKTPSDGMISSVDYQHFDLPFKFNC